MPTSITKPASPKKIVLILGSAPMAMACRDWPRGAISKIVAINNAWQIRKDWDYFIHPDDFPRQRHPPQIAPHQTRITSADYVPSQNEYGGFVYAGGTMAFTAAYWALAALRPDVMAFYGCDMVYPATGNTHFYGTGTADPLRKDISLRNLEAKSARLTLLAAYAGCACVNLSDGPSRLVFRRATLETLETTTVQKIANPKAIHTPMAVEERLAYRVPSGRYWKEQFRFDTDNIDALDSLWLEAHHSLNANGDRASL